MDRNNNVIRTKPIGITSDDKFPVSYQSANTFFHFVNKFNYLNEMISDKKIYPRYCKESLEYLDLDIKNISVAMKCFYSFTYGSSAQERIWYILHRFNKRMGNKKQPTTRDLL